MTLKRTLRPAMDADDLAAQLEDKASMRPAGGRAGGGRKAGGGAGKPGDGGKQREKQISMALSRLLRHQALNAGIKLDKEGYAPLDRVVSAACLLPSCCSCSSGGFFQLSFLFPVRLGEWRPRVFDLLRSNILCITTAGPLCSWIYSIYLHAPISSRAPQD